jgi:6-phosphogluconolactonase
MHIYKTERELAEAYADYFIELAGQSISDRGVFNVVLAGGGSPKELYTILASEYRDKVNWNEIFFFFGDERYVPATDDQSNALMAKTVLFTPLQISSANIFSIDTTLTPETSAARYQSQIVEHFGGDPICFDLIILGLGDDAHTASLFPHTSVLGEAVPGINAVYVQELNACRITMNAPLINQARNIGFLVFGKNKAQAVQQVVEGVHDTDTFPAQLISPLNGDLTWFLDREAASKLERPLMAHK